MAREVGGAIGRRHIECIDIVLYGDRQPVQRAERMALCPPSIRSRSRTTGPFGVDVDKRVDQRIQPLDLVKASLDDLTALERATLQV